MAECDDASNGNVDNDNDHVIWRIGVCDAHCHPTDIVSSIGKIAQMRAQALTIMATRSQDQELVAEAAERFPLTDVGAIMAVDRHTKYVVPSFGWHPWFSHQIMDDLGDGSSSSSSSGSNNNTDPLQVQLQHYRSILTPKCGDTDDDFVRSLPPPIRLSQYLRDTEARLRRFPYALVGEVGLDRSFRLPQNVPIEADVDDEEAEDGELTPGTRHGRPLSRHRVSLQHQKAILRAQLQLAGKLGRPVSVHSVQTHGAVFDLLQSLWKRGACPSSYPPRICMHSYSGPPDALSQFLAPAVPAQIYFSLSAVINFSSSSPSVSSSSSSAAGNAKAEAVIRAIPDDRILVESDLHCAGPRMDSLLHEVVVRVCQLKGWEVESGARQLRRNWLSFVFGAAANTGQA